MARRRQKKPVVYGPQNNPALTQKKKARKRKNKSGQKKPKMGKMAHVHAACSVLDPFCIHARAARRPDGLGINTIPYQLKGLLTITTDSTGAAYTLLVPGAKYGTVNGTLVGTQWTLGAAYTLSPASAFLTNNATEVRIVSMGAIFRSTASMADCKGLMHMAVATGLAVNSTDTALAEHHLEDGVYSLTSGFEYSWISKPIGANAHAFVPMADITSTMTKFDWTSLIVEVSGGPASTAVGVLEIFINVEAQLVMTTGIAPLIPPPKPANPIAVKTQEHVHSSMSGLVQGGIKQVETAIVSKAGGYIENFVENAGSYALALLGI